ncbi:MAG: hypothetical protein IPO27_02320 [Bacteroidetes bacterium]|nr:hypothetical protein [Bacteroidota bacterium]
MIPVCGSTIIDYSFGTPIQTPIPTILGFGWTTGYMSDSTGELLFYSNGIFL